MSSHIGTVFGSHLRYARCFHRMDGIGNIPVIFSHSGSLPLYAADLLPLLPRSMFMIEELRTQRHLHMDETTVTVLEDRKDRQKSYMWMMASGKHEDRHCGYFLCILLLTVLSHIHILGFHGSCRSHICSPRERCQTG